MKCYQRLTIPRIAVIAPCLIAMAFAISALSTRGQENIDWNRARELSQRSQRGETLSAEERAYLERARALRQQGAGPRQNGNLSGNRQDVQRARQLLEKQQKGESLTADEREFLTKVRGAREKPAAATPNEGTPKTSIGFLPLDQMSATDKYKDREGGLYGKGSNKPPADHHANAMTEASKIQPLDADGKPSPDGKVVLVSIGMSNTTQEFSKFKELAERDSAKDRHVVIVDGAQGGKDAPQWADDKSATWTVLADRLKAAGVTPAQVQVIWMKHAIARPARLGEFPQHADELKKQTAASLRVAKSRFPNLRIAYLSSRIYAGYATTALNPEPFAYESAFAVRALIQDQIKGDEALNWDSKKGAVKAPLLLWGPYLWADGMTPRKSDGLIWTREDLGPDGTHPSPKSGREKVANLLLKFLKTDPTAQRWFSHPTETAK